jgi:hypothetical protein
VRRTRRSTRAVVVALLAATVTTSVVAAQSGIVGPAGGGGGSLERAEAITPVATEAVAVYTAGELPISTMNRAIRATEQAGGTFAISSGVSIPMRGIYRSGATVQRPPSGYSIPMSLTALPQDAIGRTISRDVSALLGRTDVVMGRLTADMRGARTGDSIDLLASDGTTVRFRIAGVIDDAVLGGTELMMNSDGAARLGLTRRSSILLWGFESRAEIDAALADNDLVSTSIRIRRSWDPRNPDSGLGMARTKALLGEFAYQVRSNGSVVLDAAWVDANLPPERELLNDSIPIRARCHNTIVPAIRAALADVEAAGLGATINVYDANRAGGCFVARFNRLTPDSAIGFLSRHTWGMALDTNTVGSCQGCVPPDMHCDVVRIFRRHGFAWGGNYLVPDGMHFEYVGERRDQLPYPSRFCPNLVDAGDTLRTGDGDLPVEDTERSVLFDHHGFALEGLHDH